MRYAIFLPALLLFAVSSAFGLSVGDPASPLQAETMVKGEAVDLSKGVHVVEFWATWCGPCKVAIPHLTELAKTYQGRVDFTGVDIWEEGDNTLDKAKKFVADMGEKMTYNVAFDGKAAVMTRTFMEAAKLNGIPYAFVVKDGVIYWIGQPEALGEAVDAVLAGKVDLTTTRAEFDQRTANQEAWIAAITPVYAARQAKDYPAMLAAIDKAETAFPQCKDWLWAEQFRVLMKTGNSEVKAMAQALLAAPAGKKADSLNSYARLIVDPKAKIPNPDYPTALLLAEHAAQLSEMKSSPVLDTYALALFRTGDKAKALEVQTQAVTLAKTDPKMDAATVQELEERLEKYRKAND